MKKVDEKRSFHFCAITFVMLTFGGMGYAQDRSYSRLEIVSGDRQIAVNTLAPPSPYKIRALDKAGTPIANLSVFIGETSNSQLSYPVLFDEFGFAGFNYHPDAAPFSIFTVPPEYIGVTDNNGIAAAQGAYRTGPPAAFVVTAVSRSGSVADFSQPSTFFSVVRTAAQPAGKPSVIVEYFHEVFKHYFNTLEQHEIDLLNAGAFSGWSRSPGSFIAYANAQDAPVGTVPVCRFFSGQYTAHFYTADASECQAVIDRWPDAWTLETRNAFYIYVPDKITGQCAPELMPVYRLYSTRSGPNHRYVTDRDLRDVMVRAGWVAEGYGPEAVIMCSPK